MKEDTAKIIWATTMIFSDAVWDRPHYGNAVSRESILAATTSTSEAHEVKPRRRDKRSRKQRRKESKRCKT